MKTASLNSSFIDTYFGLLKNLSPEIKLGLIERLKNNLKKTDQSEGGLEKSFGAWESDESAEEIIKEIRESRVFNREIESF